MPSHAFCISLISFALNLRFKNNRVGTDGHDSQRITNGETKVGAIGARIVYLHEHWLLARCDRISNGSSPGEPGINAGGLHSTLGLSRQR